MHRSYDHQDYIISFVIRLILEELRVGRTSVTYRGVILACRLGSASNYGTPATSAECQRYITTTIIAYWCVFVCFSFLGVCLYLYKNTQSINIQYNRVSSNSVQIQKKSILFYLGHRPYLFDIVSNVCYNRCDLNIKQINTNINDSLFNDTLR